MAANRVLAEGQHDPPGEKWLLCPPHGNVCILWKSGPDSGRSFRTQAPVLWRDASVHPCPYARLRTRKQPPAGQQGWPSRDMMSGRDAGMQGCRDAEDSSLLLLFGVRTSDQQLHLLSGQRQTSSVFITSNCLPGRPLPQHKIASPQSQQPVSPFSPSFPLGVPDMFRGRLRAQSASRVVVGCRCGSCSRPQPERNSGDHVLWFGRPSRFSSSSRHGAASHRETCSHAPRSNHTQKSFIDPHAADADTEMSPFYSAPLPHGTLCDSLGLHALHCNPLGPTSGACA